MHVDDDLCLLEVSKQILSIENNFEIDNVISVDEAFKKMEKESYDAVVSDYEMPQKNGLDFLKELREQKRDIAFILFTGKGREDIAVKALNLGADSYIDKNGSPETVYCELADAINKTVERKKSRELLAKSESKYHALVENSLQGIAILLAAPIRLVFANGAFGRILGYSPEELTSLSTQEIMSLVYHEDRVVFFKRMENRLRGEPAGVSFEFRAVRKDGSTIWLSSLANRLNYDGQPAVQGLFLDINESKKAAEILCESEKRYRELANCLPDIVFETDLNGQLEFANKRAVEISGYSLDELERGLNIFQFIVPEDRDRATKNIQRLLSGGSYVPTEYKFMRKDGATFYALITATPRISGNKMTGLRGLVIDITERKKAEESLKESEEKFRTLSEQSPNMIFINKQGRVVYTNKKCEDTTGYTREEFYSPNFDFLSLCAPEYVEEVKMFYAKQMRGEAVASYECVLVTREGGRINSIITTNVIEYDGEKAVLGIITDITERKKAEEKLQLDEERLKLAQRISQVGIWDFDVSSGELFWDEVICRISGVSFELRPSLENFFKIVHPDDLEFVKESIQGALEGKPFDIEMRILRPDGTERVVNSMGELKGNSQGKHNRLFGIVQDITERKKAEEAIKFQADLLNHVGQAIIMVDNSRIIRFWNKAAEKLYGYSEEQALGHDVTELLGVTSPEEADEALKRLMAGESWSTETFAKNKDGSVVPVILNRTPIFKEDGEFIGSASITTDITLQKNTEADLTFSLESLSNSLSDIQELNEKLRVIGGLTRHDVRNKLSTVTGYAYILKKKHADEADVVDGLGKMEQAVKDSMKIFDFAKMYEQIGSEELTYVNVEEKLKEASALFSGPTPTIINECHDLTVLADSFLRQLFYNFIDNTRKYGKKTTTIRVYFEKTNQDCLKLIYEDDGVGVPLENKPSLFKEGFSTGGSTGFGLFLTKKMVDVYGWKYRREW